MTIRDNPLIHLNYSVFLYNKQEKSLATQQLKLYNTALRNHKPTNPDPEVCACILCMCVPLSEPLNPEKSCLGRLV